MKADSFYFYENNDEMKKPKEIIALEKLYNIQLQQTFYKDDILNVDRNNLFLLDKKENVLGLNLSGNKIDEIKLEDNIVDFLQWHNYFDSVDIYDILIDFFNYLNISFEDYDIISLNDIINQIEDEKPLNEFLEKEHQNYIKN